MRKFGFIVITLLIALFFMGGCPQELPQSAEPAITDLSEIEVSNQEAVLEVEPERPQASEQVEIETEDAAAANEPTKAARSVADEFGDKCVQVLSTFVREDGSVDYRRLKIGRLQLSFVLKQFANLTSEEYGRWEKKDKMAFWINAYNLQMLTIIIDNYPIESSRVRRLFWSPTSIRHIDGIWDKHKFIIMDEEFTLSEIEQRFFRGQFKEPRVFFTLALASVSGPKLLDVPYYGKNLDEQLEARTKAFLVREDGFRIDRKEGKVYVSSILRPSWYGGEFIAQYGTNKKFKDQSAEVRAVLSFVTNYVSEADVSFLETENYEIEYIRYDWRLNE